MASILVLAGRNCFDTFLLFGNARRSLSTVLGADVRWNFLKMEFLSGFLASRFWGERFAGNFIRDRRPKLSVQKYFFLLPIDRARIFMDLQRTRKLGKHLVDLWDMRTFETLDNVM